MLEDIDYLKRYVRKNPGNQMAWYLLGKQYKQSGQIGKAHYCFSQAGVIYEAFEKEKMAPTIMPHEMPDEWDFDDEASLARSERFTWKAWLRRGVIAAAVMFFLLFTLAPSVNEGNLPYSTDGGSQGSGSSSDEGLGEEARQGSQDESGDGQHAEEDLPVNSKDETTNVSGDPSMSASKAAIGVWYVNPLDDSGNGNLDNPNDEDEQIDQIKQFIMSATYMIMVKAKLSSDEQWAVWPDAPVFRLTAEQLSSGQLEVYEPDDSACLCIDDYPQKAAQAVERWMQQQLEEVVMTSAMAAYAHEHGRLPERLGQLAADYPNNWMSGYTEHMAEVFAERQAQVHLPESDEQNDLGSESDSGKQPTSQQGSQIAQSAEEEHPILTKSTPFEEPLSIIVDKGKHRLAVVSGNMLLRNYPVGLGGDKTPIGEYYVGEKVRDPNGGGKNNPYGTRGIALADTLYAIHGTYKLDSIERDESAGCIRMLNEDIEELYDLIARGTKITIADSGLPEEIVRPATPFKVPALNDESNPGRIYTWLD